MSLDNSVSTLALRLLLAHLGTELPSDVSNADVSPANLRSLCAGKTSLLGDTKLVDEWLAEFATHLAPGQSVAAQELKRWNDKLQTNTYLTGSSITLADIIVFAGLHKTMATMPAKKKHAFTNVARWFDNVQTHLPSGLIKPVAPFAGNSNIFTFDFSGQNQKKTDSSKQSGAKETKGQQQSQKKDKKQKKQKKAKPAKVEEPMIFHMDIRVGKVVSCAPHPTQPEAMVVSQVDIGEEKTRPVVSGIAAYYTPEQMVGKTIVLIVNLPKANIKGTESDGRVLVATSKDKKVKELVEAPEGAVIGEKVTFAGVVSPPAKVVGKKQNNKIFKCLTTDGSKTVLYKDLAFTTSKGLCTVPTVTSGTVA